jgi:hypothetical protein
MRTISGALAMSAASTPALPFDPATVQFDPLLRRLNLANTRRRWREMEKRGQLRNPAGWARRQLADG